MLLFLLQVPVTALRRPTLAEQVLIRRRRCRFLALFLRPLRHHYGREVIAVGVEVGRRHVLRDVRRRRPHELIHIGILVLMPLMLHPRIVLLRYPLLPCHLHSAIVVVKPVHNIS